MAESAFDSADKAGEWQESTSDSARRRLQPYSWDELQSLPKREYLIKGVLDRRGISVMIAPPNGAKTFHALEMAFSIARGISFRDKRVKGGSVLYIAAEGGLGIVERMEAYAKHHGLDKIPNFYLLPKPVNFFNSPEDVNEIIKEVKKIDGVEFVVIDTFAQVLSGGDENSSEGAGVALKNGQRVQLETGVHLMFIHHTGKDGNYRGFSGILGDVDTMMKIKEEDGLFTVDFSKQRDGRKDLKFSSRLKIIDLGFDEDGDPITSCVLLPTEEMPAQKQKLSARQTRAITILHNLLAERGETGIPKSGMSKLTFVRLDDFRTALKDGNIIVSDNPDNVRRGISKVIEELNNKGITATWEDKIWVAG